MTVERSGKEIIIRISSDLGKNGLKDLVNYISYKEATAKSKANSLTLINLPLK